MFKKIKIIKFVFFCCFFFNNLLSTSFANETLPFNNIAQHKSPKLISSVEFEDFYGNKLNLGDYSGKLIIINFWATWCAPCLREMPSLDALLNDKNFDNLIIFPINMEKTNLETTKEFYTSLNIKNLDIFFDPDLNFNKELNLRGVPTTVLINKERKEFARITGEVNFLDKEFLHWLLKYD